MGNRKRKGPRTCVECGVVFEGTARARYHSDQCRSRAYFREHRAALVEAQRQRRQQRRQRGGGEV